MKTNKSILVYTFIFSVLFAVSCKKETITTHENLVVSGNVAPPYDGVPTIKIEVYINKLYIDLLGIQPSSTELNYSVNYLKDNKLRMGARDTLVSQLLNKDQYFERLFTLNSAKFIEGINKYQIDQEIATQVYISTFLLASGDTFSSQIVDLNIVRLTTLSQSDSLYKNNIISLNEFYASFTNNSFYEDLNMGSLNFVKASFEHYFSRQGSQTEITNGVKIVDNQSAILLMQNGNSKQDFINIMTNSNEFYQGLVIESFRDLLSRNPSSVESSVYTQEIKATNNLGNLKKNILILDEYAGF